MEINVTAKIGDRFTHGLQEVLSVIDQINQSHDDEDILVFSENIFITPLFILPLMVYISGCNKEIRYRYTNNYLDTICFGTGGIIPEKIGTNEFNQLLNKCSSKTYIPIISFPTSVNYTKERNGVISTIEDILSNQSKLQPNITRGLKYLIGEIVDNIVEHSESERGYIFTQYFPRKRYLDVCIADRGITLLGSYRKMTGNTIEDHLSAMKAANQGISTKNLPDAENRGYGILTSKKMIIGGLSGNFIMLSGNALYLKSREVDQSTALPDIVNWQGTIVAMRIPYINKRFDYIDFVE